MIITYNKEASFKIQFGKKEIVFNPIKKTKADIVLLSLNEKELELDEGTFLINGAGEYEVGGITIHGFGTTVKYNGKERINTIYLLTIEDMNVCHLGALSSTNIDKAILEEIASPDVLFTPISGGELLSPKNAHDLGVSLEAKIIIPTYVDDKSLKTFLKEEGDNNGKVEEKLTLKKKDLLGANGSIVVLKG